jgi:hypothetical protein
MTSKGFYLLTAATAASIVAAVALTPAAVTERAKPGERFFPSLDAKSINAAASLTVTHKGKSFSVHQKDGAWAVKEFADYPAETGLVRKALFALTELRPHEAKTKDPARLAKLDLDDPASKEASGKQLTVKDKDGKVLADLVIGKGNSTNVILGKEMVYIRKAGDNQAWLAEGDPSLKAEALDWVVRALIDIDVERIRETVTKDEKGGLRAHLAKEKAEDKDFALKNLPEGRKTKEARQLAYVAEALDNVTLDDVKKAADIDFEKNAVGSGVWRSFDGLVVAVKMAEQDKKFWIAITAEVDEAALLKEKPKPESKLRDADAVKKEAAEINARVMAWAYHVPTTSSRFMQYKLEDLLEEVKKEEPKKDEPKKDEEKK